MFRVVGQFLLARIIVKTYRIYRFLYRKTIRLRPQFDNTVFSFFTRRSFLFLSLFLLTGIIITSNLRAYGASRPEDFGSESLLNFLVAQEELGYLIEEKVTFPQSSEVVGEDYTSGRVSQDTSPLTTEFGEDMPMNGSASLAGGGTAIVKPSISGEEDEMGRSIEPYVVQAGDTIVAIAERFGVSIETILWENNLSAKGLIRPGQQLAILPVTGVTHTVKRGDTISKIAKRYAISPEKIIEFNRLASADDLQIGEKLIIPNGKKYIPPTPQWRSLQEIVRGPAAGTSVGDKGHIWPTTCRRITQYFTWRHLGIDIACKSGQPVYASQTGTVKRVVYGWNGGYGNMVIIDHGSGVQTLYGHNATLLVSVGAVVSQGDVIATIGSTGRSTGFHVHYEVRVSGRRVNPFEYAR